MLFGHDANTGEAGRYVHKNAGFQVRDNIDIIEFWVLRFLKRHLPE